MCEAIIGLVGALIGAIATLGGVFVKDCLDARRRNRLDHPRREMLKTMLLNPPVGTEWRNLQTLSRVIGADYAETTRLLIEIGARGNELEKDVWALKSAKPLNTP